MIKSDKILDITDKINSLEYFINTDEIGDMILKSELVIERLNDLSDELISKTSSLNSHINKETIQKSVYVGNLIKNKMTSYLSLIFKIELLKDKVTDKPEIKVSKYVSDFITDV